MKKGWYFIALAVLQLALPMPVSQAQTFDRLLDASQEHAQSAQSAQARINRLDDEASALAQDYRASLRQTEALRSYNAQLQTLIAAQQKRQSSLRTQIDNVITIERMVVPVMLRSLAALEEFVALDLPFLKTERQQRLARLRTLLERVDVSAAEKYRKLMEAYEIELEYGRTIETYEDELRVGDVPHMVAVLRIGRLALMYQTLDGATSAVWDAGGWQPVSGALARAIGDNLAIAREQRAPELMIVPLKAGRQSGE